MKLTDYKRAVNALILAQMDGLDVPIVDADLTEPIIRPSVKTFVDSGEAGRENSCMAHRRVTTDIYFFAADRERPRMENMGMQDRLALAFLDGIDPDEDTHIELLEDVEFTTEDGVLHARFDVDVYAELENDADGEYMDTLAVDVYKTDAAGTTEETASDNDSSSLAQEVRE